MEKQSTKSKGGRRPGAGRPKGSLDKGNALIRDMLGDALHQVGGVDYLARIAESHPAAFSALIGKLMPTQIEGTGPNGEVTHSLTIGFK